MCFLGHFPPVFVFAPFSPLEAVVAMVAPVNAVRRSLVAWAFCFGELPAVFVSLMIHSINKSTVFLNNPRF